MLLIDERVEKMESPDDIVGHKTFSDPENGPLALRHEPLTRAEAEAIRDRCDAEDKRRQESMPDEKSAINHMWDGWYRLKDFGWREAIYCPKDGTSFQVIEPGSTGIFPCHYQGEWPAGSWWIEEDGGCPSHPVLFKLYPEDQAKYDARMAEARARYAALSAP